MSRTRPKIAVLGSLLAAASLLAACATRQSVQGNWGSTQAGDCHTWGVTISATSLSIKMAGSSIDQQIDLEEDARGADADIYLLGSDKALNRKLNTLYPIRLSLQNDELTFSSDDEQPLGKAWLKLLQVMQPLHRCPNT